MNIMNFFTPKSNVAYLLDTYTLRQTMEKMENSGYSAIPILDKENHYVGTMTEGDVLWYIKNSNLQSLRDCEKHSLSEIKRRRDNIPVTISTSIDDILKTALDNNFVPVIDDRGYFIGIVTRKSIINNFLYGEIKEEIEELREQDKDPV